MIKVYADTEIFIVCPPNHATGGTELLHQLACKLKQNNYIVYMYYTPGNNQLYPVHERFTNYNIDYTSIINDTDRNILIIPEIYIELFRNKQFKKIGKVVWWLSVDDYLKRINEVVNRKKKHPFFALKKLIGKYRFPDLNFFKRSRMLHLVQSQYAFAFLSKHNIQVCGYLSDYLNKEFLDKEINNNREAYVLYNPLKGYEFTEKLILLASDLKWVPIEKMSPHQVADLLSKSKVYVDFGHHPGKDRFPREAAIMGCCVITGKQGSANFFEDLPIPGEFKFDEFNIDPLMIIEKIKNCLNNYTVETKKFDSYRETIKLEEKRFEEDLLKVFKKVNE